MRQKMMPAALILLLGWGLTGCGLKQSPTTPSLGNDYSFYSFFNAESPIGIAASGGILWTTSVDSDLLAWTQAGNLAVSIAGTSFGVHAGPDGYIYCMGTGALEFDPVGNYVASFGAAQYVDSYFTTMDVAVSSQYAYLIQKTQVVRFTITGTGSSKVFSDPATFADSGTGVLQEGVLGAVDTSGDLYVADFQQSEILKYSPSGTYQMSATLIDSGRPFGVAVRSDGNLFATDVVNGEVQEFNSSGQPVTAFGQTELGSNAGNYFSLAFDAQDNLFVAGQVENRIFEFKSN